MAEKIKSLKLKLIFALITLSLFLAGCGGKTTASSDQAGPGSKTPPLVPHEIQTRSDCLACHRMGMNGAPKIVHATSNNCLTCHRLRQ